MAEPTEKKPVQWLPEGAGSSLEELFRKGLASRGQIPAEILWALEEAGYLDLLKQATSLAELEQIIGEAIQMGVIPFLAGDAVYDNYAVQVSPVEHLYKLGVPEKDVISLLSYTDKGDLARRINALNLPSTFPGIDPDALYGGLLGAETGYGSALRGEAVSQIREQQRQRQAFQQQESRAAPGRAQALTEIYNSPYITQQDMTQYRDLPVDDFINVLQAISNQRASQAERRPELRRLSSESEGFLRAMNIPPYSTEERARPPLPSGEPLVEGAIKGIGYGAGTKLRSYFESQIPGIAGGVQEARQKWWEEMHPKEPETYEDAMGKLRAREKQLGALAGSASTGAIYGGSYYGEGGPAALAQHALERIQGDIAGLRPGDFPSGTRQIEQKEDPLKVALRNLQGRYKPEYYRRPGTGLGGSLTPSLKFR